MSDPRSKPNRFVYWFLRGVALVVSKLLWRVSFEGEENIPVPTSGALIIAANHQTYIDPVWISIPIRHRLLFLAWDRAFTWPVLGRLIRYLGAVPVNTANGRSAGSWRAALTALRSGDAVLIFPEGARAFADGRLLDFKPGAVRMAIEAGAPVLPVTVRGANRIWPQGQRWPKRGRVEVIFHPLVNFENNLDPLDRKGYIETCEERLKSVIASGLD